MNEYPKQEAIAFFAEHGGYSRRPDETDEEAKLRCGRESALAELEAASRGWFVTWAIDRDADIIPTDDYFVSGNEQWEAALWDMDGHLLDSLCGIDFAEDYAGEGTNPQRDPYARVVAAQMADVALSEIRTVVKGRLADEAEVTAGRRAITAGVVVESAVVPEEVRQPEVTLTHPITQDEYPAPPGADIVTCWTCHRSWDDSLPTSLTPAPSARCPFEYEHEDAVTE